MSEFSEAINQRIRDLDSIIDAQTKELTRLRSLNEAAEKVMNTACLSNMRFIRHPDEQEKAVIEALDAYESLKNKT